MPRLAHHLDPAGRRGRASAASQRADGVKAVTSLVDPLPVTRYAVPDRRMVIAALNDRVTWVTGAQRLHDHWQARIHWYPGGHVGQALSGQVRGATDAFLSS